MTSLRELWRNGETTLGGWLALPNTVSAEALAGAGFDFVCVDTQHGAIDYQTAIEMVRAIAIAGPHPLVRVPWNEPGIIAKMLDGGAQGVIVPMVNSVEEAEAAVRACRYAPAGSRSYGPTVAKLRIDNDYLAWASDNIAVIPMIETAQAVDSIDDILAVDGVDAIYVGPADLSLTLGLPPANNDDNPLFVDALETIARACENAGVVAGIHSTGALTPRRLEMGYRMVVVTSDLVAMGVGLEVELALARGEVAQGGSGDIY